MTEHMSADGASEWAARATSLGTATLHEAAGQRGALPAAIRRMTPGLVMAGRAVTVSGPPGDNLWLHRATYIARPGDVLVAEVGGQHEAGYWGEILSCAARAKGVAGVVIDGCVRDGERLPEIGVPVFARGLCMRGTSKRSDGPGAVNQPVRLGDAVVHPGDVVLGDGDGVLALPFADLAAVLELGRARQRHEEEILAALRAGATTMDLYDLPLGDMAAWAAGADLAGDGG